MSQIILASGSPRRKELLGQMGLEFTVCPAHGEEVCSSRAPEDVVRELSKQKAEEVAAGLLGYQEGHRELVTPQDLIVIGADTVVAYHGEILGKPTDEEDAARMLGMLSGNTHSVYTGVCVVIADRSGRTGELGFYEKTEVEMHEISEEEIADYIASGEPMDKAGAYGIQGRCAIHIRRINGDYNNVVGLPISRLYQELKKIGIHLV